MLFFTPLFFSCNNDEATKKTDEEVQLALLSKTWKLLQVNFEDTEDRTSSFSDGKLILSGSYVTAGTYDFSFTGSRPTLSPWPASGKWKFGSNVNQDIIRNPTPSSPSENLPLNYTVTESQLTITFTCVTCDFPGGRKGAINGEWEFIFSNP